MPRCTAHAARGPVVCIVPVRTRSANAMAEVTEADARRMEFTKLIALRRDVRRAKSNRALAKTVVDFRACIDGSGAKNLTKNALKYLEDLETALTISP